MMTPRLDALDAFLLDLNRASAEAILPLFRAEHGLQNKARAGAFDPVTLADRNAEAAIRKLIAARYPEHGVIGEEYGEDRPEAEWVWVIDPVDGTRAFVAGLPVWTTLIALRHAGRPVLGSIGQPCLGEIYIGQAGGARLVNRDGVHPLHVRRGVAMDQAILATTDPDGCFEADERLAWRQIRAAARLARTGCDAYAYAQVAAGHIDLVVEAGLKSWDIEAAIPVLQGAGGFVTDWRGKPVGRDGGQVAIAGDRAILDAALVALAPAAKAGSEERA
ncbi:MAG: histidinol-phosphatase [Alphaproteobacteria bacterium]|nr:histidinol-phosphatase [Alphaproteobacteria bacterium]